MRVYIVKFIFSVPVPLYRKSYCTTLGAWSIVGSEVFCIKFFYDGQGDLFYNGQIFFFFISIFFFAFHLFISAMCAYVLLVNITYGSIDVILYVNLKYFFHINP